MELRAIARRCPSRSMTVLGDLAQATAPGAAVELGRRGRAPRVAPTASIEELELGYRVPKPILDVANRLLPEVAPGVRAARSVRLDGPAPGDRPRRAGRSSPPAPRRRCATWPPPGRRWGSSSPSRGAIRWPRALREAGVDFGTGARGGLAARRHAPRPARGQGPRVRRRRGRGAERDLPSTSAAAGCSTSPSPERCRRSPSCTPTRSPPPSPPDEGSLAGGSTLGAARRPRSRRHPRAEPLPPLRLDHGRRGRRARRRWAWPWSRPCRSSAAPAVPRRR